ncbi:MAG: Rrf2 family transcriptional regulator [Myxococcales bacterium]|nr:MAG: Rrf2 family transcriptional regulator [Myxococcales bacterium]
MIITRKTTYALRALKHLAETGGELTLTSRISEQEGIPQRFLEAILRELSRHGVLSVKRGRGGGYSLRQAPRDLTIARIIDIVDGHASQFACLDPIHPTRCAECPGPGACAAQVVLNKMGNASQRVLESLTLADLIVPQLEASNQ